MIIHHDDLIQPSSIDNIKDKLPEDEINATGTMIIKKKEIEFSKSNNWHIILAKEKNPSRKETEEKKKV